jgi:hypothetical protein
LIPYLPGHKPGNSELDNAAVGSWFTTDVMETDNGQNLESSFDGLVDEEVPSQALIAS